MAIYTNYKPWEPLKFIHFHSHTHCIIREGANDLYKLSVCYIISTSIFSIDFRIILCVYIQFMPLLNAQLQVDASYTIAPTFPLPPHRPHHQLAAGQSMPRPNMRMKVFLTSFTAFCTIMFNSMLSVYTTTL